MIIPFLLDYEQYQPPSGTRIINSVSDMVVINFNPPAEIKYAIGTNFEYSNMIRINNITSNVTLEIAIEFNRNVLEIYTNNTTSPYVFTVGPAGRIAIPVKLNTRFLDSRANTEAITETVKFTVKNLSNGLVAFKAI